MTMKKLRTLLLPAVFLAASAAQGDTLLQVYEKAMRSDPLLREAEANRLAIQEGKPIARGALLPQISGRANWGKGAADGEQTTFFGGQTAARAIDSRDDRNSNWTLELRQTLFRWDQWAQFNKADKEANQADVDYQAAQQDLIVRVAEAYFNVLAAEDTLASEQASKEAIGRQLEQAQKRFEVGLIAITDVQEAQAAYDQAVATEILAKRTLANQREVLRAIIAEMPPALAKPGEDIPLSAPDPASEEEWVRTALAQNLGVISSRLGADIARDDVNIARAGHLPTLDFVASRNNVDNEGYSRNPCVPQGGEVTCTTPGGGVVGPGTIFPSPTGTDLETDSLSLQLSVPIFSGGQTSSRTQQAVYRHRAARERLERTARETERQTRDAYLGVISDISRVQALKQALESARTALKATEAGYEVGTRTTVDVLDARRALFLAETNYLRSRYDYLINGLRLKQAAGTLSVDDLARIDSLLQEASTTTP
jgi:outer membrane protein